VVYPRGQPLPPTPPEQPLRPVSGGNNAVGCAGTLKLLRTQRLKGTWEEIRLQVLSRYKGCAVSSRRLWLRRNYCEKAGRPTRSPTNHGPYSQCRKWRIPVKTMARPRRSAADDVGIAHDRQAGSPRRSRFRCFFDAVGNGKNVGSYHSTGQRGLRFHHCDFHGIARSSVLRRRQRRAILRKHDGIRFYVLGNLPRETHRAHLFRGCARFVTVRSSLSLISPRSGCCTSIPPRMRLELQFVFRLQAARRAAPAAAGFLRRENFFRAVREPGAGDAFRKSFATSSASPHPRAVERQHTAERRDRRRTPALSNTLSAKSPVPLFRRDCVLDDHAADLGIPRPGRAASNQLDCCTKVLALELLAAGQTLRCAARRHVQCRGLVRIFSIF